MKRMIQTLTGNYSASASVVDGTLIISLPDAINPVVWRLDLGQARASAMEIRAQENGTFMLTLKTPRNDVNDIAGFSTKASALTALMAISQALEHAHGRIRPVANDAPLPMPSGTNTLPVPVRHIAPKKKSAKGKGVLAGLVAVVLIVILLGALANIAPMPSSVMRNANPAAGGSSAATSTGVPLSADDFLKNR